MGELIGSEESLINIKLLTDTLLARQVQEGPRRGSFNPKPIPTYYYDYTAPVALLAAYESPRTSGADKERYLQAVKKWLTRAYAEQREDGTIPPFLPPPEKKEDVKKNEGDDLLGEKQAQPKEEPKPDPLVEPTAGILWVATRYQDIIKHRQDHAELAKLSDPKLKEEIGPKTTSNAPAVDADPLDTLVRRCVASLKKSQALRTDGLFPTSAGYNPTYYTTDAHIHAALASAMRTYDKNSDVYKDSKAMDDRLAQGMHEFAYVKMPPKPKANPPQKDAKEEEPRFPFFKGPLPMDFLEYPGHHMVVEGYGAALSGKHQYFDMMKKDFENAMSNEDKGKKFLEAQTMPAGLLVGLQATGTKSITINGKKTSLEKLMEDQLKDLMAPLYLEDKASPPVAASAHLHKVALACMTGYQGCDWLPKLGEYKGPTKEQGMFADPAANPFAFPKGENLSEPGAMESLDPAEFGKENPKESERPKFPVAPGDEPPHLSGLPPLNTVRPIKTKSPGFPR